MSRKLILAVRFSSCRVCGPRSAEAAAEPPACASLSAGGRNSRSRSTGGPKIPWADAELTGFSVFWEKKAGETHTAARLMWDDEYLYFTAEMEDYDLYADVTSGTA